MGRGGRRSTTFSPGWKHGKTRTIRVPVALADKLLDVAREFDEGQDFAATQAKDEEIRQLKDQLGELIIQILEMQKELDSKKLDQGAMLTALKRYIKSQQSSPGGNQHRRKGEPLNIEKSRDWKHFVKFMKEIEGNDNNPV